MITAKKINALFQAIGMPIVDSMHPQQVLASLIASEKLPEGYAIVKDAVLDIWHVSRLDALLNASTDRPQAFFTCEEACERCWIHALAEKMQEKE